MGLYSTFNTSQYYDDVSDIKQEKKKVVDYKKPHSVPTNHGLTLQKRKSLYEESKKVREKSEFSGINFNELYRIGQAVAIQSPNGTIRTRKGRIVEIVDRDLMYVAMEDTYKDVNDHWLVDFVTAKDKITKI